MSSEPAHSNFIGGSNCAARIACPASWSMEQKLPTAMRKETSVYADEGSALHMAMAYAFENDIVDATELVGMQFVVKNGDEWTITQEHAEEALQPCFDFFDALDAELGGIDFRIEKRVQIPFLPGVFGTADLIGKSAHCSVIGDWKFGVGELVNAWYENAEGGIDANEQCMFYLLGAINSYPDMFNASDPDWPVEMFVAQPRHREGPNFDRIRVTMRDVTAFGVRLAHAAHLAKGEAPPMKKGAHCRFMSCKSICPLHTGPLLDVSALNEMLVKSRLEASVEAAPFGEIVAIDWGKTYGLMLDLAKRIEPLIEEWRKQAHTYVEEGGTVDGWKLVSKRAQRKWIKPEQSVERKLYRMGLDKDQRMPRALVSAPQAEKILKKMGQELPEGYFDAVSSGLTLAPDSDPRKSTEPVGSIIDALAKSLAAITATEN